MNKIITQEVVDALLRYLVQRPYSEVYQVIPVLQNLPAVSPLETNTEEIK